MSYRILDIDKTIQSIERLKVRIGERFPASGIFNVSCELTKLATESSNNINKLSKPIWWLRVLAFILVLFIFFITTVLLISFKNSGYYNYKFFEINFADFTQALESLINDIIFICLAIYFLFRFEIILKRKKILKNLHEIRTIAHVIDMHQLTKDSKNLNVNRTEHSPERVLNNYELCRYLEYCIEMLSLSSKMATIYANKFDDEIVLNSINEIEELTTGLCNKIWQKIIMVKNEINDLESKYSNNQKNTI